MVYLTLIRKGSHMLSFNLINPEQCFCHTSKFSTGIMFNQLTEQLSEADELIENSTSLKH